MASRRKRERSVHIHAPVQSVFDYLQEPVHFVAGMAASHGATLGTVNRTPEGLVTSFDLRYRELGRDLTTVVTREEFLPNRRIVDHASAGPVHMFTFEPDATGTRLTYSWDAPKFMKMLDAIFVHSDQDAERALAIFKREIEALP